MLVEAGSSGAVGVPTASPAVQVNKTEKVLPLSRDEEGPALLVDKDDPNTVYLAYSEMTSGACKFSVSTDAGATWRPEAAPSLDPYTKNCAMGYATSQNIRTELKQGPDGTIYNVFQANAADKNGSRSVLIGRSTDGGRSWQTSVIDPGNKAPEPGVEMEVNFEGHIAVDPANSKHLYAMWRRSFNRFTPAKTTNPYMSVSEDGGATWAPPQLMFSRNNGFDGPRPVVVGDKLFAFWRESAPPIPTNQEGPAPAPPVTRLFASISTDKGKTWTDHEITNANDASEPVPLYDAKRQVFHVVWHDNRAKELDAYYASSKDGITWSQPKRLNDDPTDTLRGQHYPQISMSANGRLDVAWYDWRDDSFPPSTVGNGQTLSLFSNRGVFAAVYMTSSSDGGATWTKNVKVSDVPIDRGVGTWENNIDVMAPIAVASSDRAAVVAWSDTRNANATTVLAPNRAANASNQTQDIFTGTVTFGKVTAHRVTSFQAGVVGVLLGLGLSMCLALLLMRRQNPPASTPPKPLTKQPEPVS